MILVLFIFCVFKIINNKNIVVNILINIDMLNKLDFIHSLLNAINKNAGIEIDPFIKNKLDILELLFRDSPLAISSIFTYIDENNSPKKTDVVTSKRLIFFISNIKNM